MNERDFDVLKRFPPKQEGKILKKEIFSCFGFSLQGVSHIESDVPCQDYNELRFVKEAGVLLACIADGVGSCELSHWGAYTAVTSALDYSEKEIKKHSWYSQSKLTDEAISGILQAAFYSAVDAVEDLADRQGLLPYVFQSTLTLMMYDGKKVYCQHAGDDGVVVQFKDGSVEMMTSRLKGEEANSVFPLQSGESCWQFTHAGEDQRGPVVAVIMATDGVLDAFVMKNNDFRSVNGCCNGVYYPFMEPAVYYPVSDKRFNRPGKTEDALEYYHKRMNEKTYRQKVTDDLTLVSVINHRDIVSAQKPVFDKEAFARTGAEIRSRARAALYPELSSEEIKRQDTDNSPSKIDSNKAEDCTMKTIEGKKRKNDDHTGDIVSRKKKKSFGAKALRFIQNNSVILTVSLVFIIIAFILGIVVAQVFNKTREQDNISLPREQVQTEEKQNKEENEQDGKKDGEPKASDIEHDSPEKKDDGAEEKTEESNSDASNDENVNK